MQRNRKLSCIGFWKEIIRMEQVACEIRQGHRQARICTRHHHNISIYHNQLGMVIAA
jgi:hypothetical protein